MNILYRKEIRKAKGKWFTSYYNREDWTLREKLYALWFKSKETGLITRGEVNWSHQIIKSDNDYYNQLEQEFNKDYIEYLKNPLNK